MLLRLTLWALLIGTLVMGYFGIQSGSATTTIIGALISFFVLFLLYFLAKNIMGFGVTIFKIILICVVVFFAGVAVVKGFTMAYDKTLEFTKSTADSMSSKIKTISSSKDSWYDHGDVKGSKRPDASIMDKMTSFLDLGKRPINNTIPPSAELPIMTGENDAKDAATNANAVPTISGMVSAVHSGTLFKIKDRFIKLYGIDAPDINQKCIDRQASQYPCGNLAKNKLKQLIFNNTLTCTLVATDGMGNYVATCKLGKYDVGAVMVSAGWAVADRNSGYVYEPYEQEAQKSRKGLWEGKFMAPWKHRRMMNGN